MKQILLLLLVGIQLQLNAQSGGPTYPIGTIRGNNSIEGGLADSINVKCKVVGVVYGNNFRASNNGLTFSIKDQTGWIGLFKDNTNLGVNLQEGDSIRAIGIVSAFNGLSQITLDSIHVLGNNSPLFLPQIVTSLNESTESGLVKLEGWQIINPAEWITGSGSGFTVRINKGTDTIDLRIDNDCSWFNQPAPSGILDIIGLGGQFDATIPRNSGYQLLPRRLSDIFVQGTTLKVNFPESNSGVGEANGQALVNVRLNISSQTAVQFKVFIKSSQATSGLDYNFNSPLTINFAPNQTEQTFPVSIIDDALAELPESITFVLRPGTGTNASLIGPDSIFILSISDNDGGSSLIPTYKIGNIRGNNAVNGGLPDSMNVYCRLQGTIYGLNLVGGNGFQFTLRDQTGGISISSLIPLVANLQEGDSIVVIGKVNHLNGLGQLRVDSMRRVATNQLLKSPVAVNQLNESTESDLIRLFGYQLVNPAEWTTGIGSTGFSARIFKGADTLRLRIDNNSSLFNDPPPLSAFNATGIGWQSDISNPYTSGYHLMPRGSSDIQLVTSNPLSVFSQNTVSANEGTGTIQIPIKLLSPSATAIQVRVVIKGGSATTGSDFIISSNPVISFAPGVLTSTLSLTVLDDATMETDETIELVLRSVNSSQVGSDSLFTVIIVDNDQPGAFVPTYPIGLIRGNNAIEGGVADSLNVTCKITGTLYGPNLRGVNNGIQFTVRDNSGGINIFKSSTNFGLTFQEGDSVRAIGKIAQFNGLSQLNLDSIFVLAAARPLQPATAVDSLDEFTESNLVKITGFQIVNPAQWTNGVGTGFTIQVSNGTRTIDLRIDNDCELFNQTVPMGEIISITGLGGQFDGTVPRNSGYQLIPRKTADLVLNVGNQLSNAYIPVSLYPNPTNGKIQIRVDHQFIESTLQFELFNSQGRCIYTKSGMHLELAEMATYILGSSPTGIYRASISMNGQNYQTTILKY